MIRVLDWQSEGPGFLTSRLLLPMQSFTTVSLQYIQYCIFNVLLAATVVASELEPEKKKLNFLAYLFVHNHNLEDS